MVGISQKVGICQKVGMSRKERFPTWHSRGLWRSFFVQSMIIESEDTSRIAVYPYVICR